MADDDVIVTVEDLRKVRKGKKDGYCLPGLERWAAENGLSLRAMLRDGIPASKLEKMKDPYVGKLLTVARERVAKEKGNGIS